MRVPNANNHASDIDVYEKVNIVGPSGVLPASASTWVFGRDAGLLKDKGPMANRHPIQVFFSSHHPLAARVEADFEGSAGNTVHVSLKATADLVADMKTGKLHSGFATIVLDSIMGGAVMGTLKQLMPIATVGLSVNHLRKPVAGETIRGKAVCVSHHNSLAYVTGELIDENDQPIAIATGTFMIGTRSTSIRNRGESRI